MSIVFPISRDPPEGGTVTRSQLAIAERIINFPISRDPPEGGTSKNNKTVSEMQQFSNF